MRALPAGCCTVASTGCAYVFSSFLREACEQKPPCSWRRMLSPGGASERRPQSPRSTRPRALPFQESAALAGSWAALVPSALTQGPGGSGSCAVAFLPSKR